MKSGESFYNWILDNGHGHNTRGKRSPILVDGSQLLEFEFNRALVLGISTGLDVLGITNEILVPEIYDIRLRDRVKRANRLKSKKPKFGISVHGNGFGKNTAHGIEVITYFGQTKSDEFADVLLGSLKTELADYDMRLRTDTSDGDLDKEMNLYILRKTSFPFVLSENGFMTNPREARFMLNQNFRKAVIFAHINAIVKFEALAKK